MKTASFLTFAVILASGLLPAALAQPAIPQTADTSPMSGGSALIVENAGQWPATARFQVWNSPLAAGTTWLAEDAIWLVVAGDKLQVAGSERRVDLLADLQPATLHALKLTFPGSNPDVRLEPFEPVDTTISYFLGNDPAKWRPGVPVWGGVRYVDLYPGVDLVLGGRDGGWHLQAASGAAVEQVWVKVEGADVAGLDRAALKLAVNGEPLSLILPSAPFAYQATGLSHQGDRLTLAVYPDQHPSQMTRPVDDPTDALYATFLGGGDTDYSVAIAVDGTGSAYVTGQTWSSSFPTTPGIFDPSYTSNGDAFVARLNPAGGGLVYATFLGGWNRDFGYGIALDETGTAYVTGATGSSDFPTTAGAFDQSFNSGYYSGDGFVVRLNPAGSALVYATFLGGAGEDYGNAIAVDEAGNAYVTGWTDYGNFPTTPGAFDPTHNGSYDVFVAKLNAAGSALTYATFLGATREEVGLAIAVDEVSSAYVTGYTYSAEFPVTPGALGPSYSNLGDVFVARLNPTGSRLIYATFLGGSDYEAGTGIAVDQAGSAYVTGNTLSANFPATPGVFDPSFNVYCDGTPCYDAFVAKLNLAGSELTYSTSLGGTSGNIGSAIALDEVGNVYVTGETGSSDFLPYHT